MYAIFLIWLSTVTLSTYRLNARDLRLSLHYQLILLSQNMSRPLGIIINNYSFLLVMAYFENAEDSK